MRARPDDRYEPMTFEAFLATPAGQSLMPGERQDLAKAHWCGGHPSEVTWLLMLSCLRSGWFGHDKPKPEA